MRCGSTIFQHPLNSSVTWCDVLVFIYWMFTFRFVQGYPHSDLENEIWTSGSPTAFLGHWAVCFSTVRRVLWQQGRDSLPAESLQGSCCETQLPGVRLGLGLSKLPSHAAVVQHCPSVIHLMSNIFPSWSPSELTLTWYMLVISLLIISPFNTGKWTAGESWEVMKISIEGLDSWSSSFSSRDPHQDVTAQYSLLQRSWSKTCQTSSTWISPNRIQLRSHHVKRTFLKNPIPQKTTKDRRMVPWNMPLWPATAPWCPDVPWPCRTTEEWHHSACRPALRAMRSSSPRLGRMTRHYSRRSDWMGSLHVLPIFEGNLHVGKGRFSRIGPPGCWLKSLKFRIHQKNWCVCDGNFWGYLEVWKSVSLFWMEWGTAFSEVYRGIPQDRRW